MNKSKYTYWIALSLSVFLTSCSSDSESEAPQPPTPLTAPILDFDSDGLEDAVDLDDDNDGLPDNIETSLGLNPLDANDADEDWDSDGFTNLEEFYLNTSIEDAESFPVQSDWSTYQGNAQHTGFSLQIVNAEEITLLWREANEMIDGSAPLANQNSVFIVGILSSQIPDEEREYSILKLGNQTAALDWQYSFENTSVGQGDDMFFEHIHTPPLNNITISENSIFAQLHGSVSNATQLFDTAFFDLIDLETGESQRTRFSHVVTGDRGFAPTFYNGNFFVYQGMFDQNGSVIRLGQWAQPSAWGPTVNDSQVIQCEGMGDFAEGTSNFGLFDLNTQQQESFTIERWRGCASGTTPVMGNFDNVLGVNEGVLTNLDLNTREVLWAVETNNIQPAVAFGKVFSARSNTLLVLEELTGEEIWRYTTAQPISSNIVVSRNVVFFGTEQETLGLDMNSGELVWSETQGGNLAISHGILYIGGRGFINAYSLE